MQVLSLYKRISRLARTWNAANPANTNEERNYIQTEARFWFRRNSSVSDPQAVRDHIQEAEARVEMGKFNHQLTKAAA